MPACRVFDHDIHGIGVVDIQGNRETKFRGQTLLDISPVITGIRALVDATVVLLVQYIRLGRMLDEPVNTLPELRIHRRQEAGPHIFVGKDPAAASIIRAHAAHSRDAHPHSGCIRGVGNDGVQAQSTGSRLPAFTCRMIGKPGIQVPGHTAISADPQTCRIDAHVDGSRLIKPAWLDHPDVVKFLTAVLRELDACLRLLPRLTKVIAVAQKSAKEVPIVGCKQPVAIARIENGMIDAMSSQSRTLDIPMLSIFRGQGEQPSFGSNQHHYGALCIRFMLGHNISFLCNAISG